MIETVFVLGAGASKGEHAPLQKDLIKDFFDFYSEQAPSNHEEYRNQLDLLDYFFTRTWGIGFRNYPSAPELFPTFEECLGIIDEARTRGEGIRGFSKSQLAEIRSALIFLIAKILENRLQSTVGIHANLIANLRKRSQLRGTAFVSLNYDILIDNALMGAYDEYHVDYGITLKNYGRRYDFEAPDPSKAVLLLKLHGSLNWLYCPTCNTLERTPKKATRDFYKPRSCDKCETKVEPVIVPPTFVKDLTNPFLQQIHLRAYEVLRSAKSIVFCGYSFPDADLNVKYLLKRAELFQKRNYHIYIFNETRKPEEDNRFLRFFRSKTNVVSTGLSFEELCQMNLDDLGSVQSRSA